MIVIDKKKILKIVLTAFVAILIFAITLNKKENDYIETVSLPVSGKVVVIDAGHGVPDERGCLLKSKKVAYIRYFRKQKEISFEKI